MGELRKHLGERRLLGPPAVALFVPLLVSGLSTAFTRRIQGGQDIPVIRAVVEPSHRDGSRVRVMMRLPVFVMVFMGIWLTAATFGALAIATASLVDGSPGGLIALLLPTVGAAFIALPFRKDASIAERHLRGIYAPAPGLPEPPETGVAYR